VDAWLLAPVVVLVLGGATLVVALRSARRSAAALAADRPALAALESERAALRDDLHRVAARLDGRSGGAGASTADR
jgi:hypothetical protein